MPKRSAKGSSTTARVAKRGSAQRVAHSSNQSAANLFINTLEIRRHFFDLLDTPTLAAFTRVEKGLTYDVARVLYKTVDYVRLRDTMARANARRAIYCDAVRFVTLEISEMPDRILAQVYREGDEFTDADKPDSQQHASVARLAAALLPWLQKKCPNVTHMLLDQATTSIEVPDGSGFGKITTWLPWDAQTDTQVNTASDEHYPDLTRSDTVGGYTFKRAIQLRPLILEGHLAEIDVSALPGTVASLYCRTRGILIDDLVEFLHRLVEHDNRNAGLGSIIIDRLRGSWLTLGKVELLFATLRRFRLETLQLTADASWDLHTFAYHRTCLRYSNLIPFMTRLSQELPDLKQLAIAIGVDLPLISPTAATSQQWRDARHTGLQKVTIVLDHPIPVNQRHELAYGLTQLLPTDCQLIVYQARLRHDVNSKADYHGLDAPIEHIRRLSKRFAPGSAFIDFSTTSFRELGVVHDDDLLFIDFDAAGQPKYVLHTLLDRFFDDESESEIASNDDNQDPKEADLLESLRELMNKPGNPCALDGTMLRCHARVRYAQQRKFERAPFAGHEALRESWLTVLSYLERSVWGKMDKVMLRMVLNKELSDE